MAFHSVFFKDLFFGVPKKENVKEEKVDGTTPEDFSILLGYLYRVDDTITEENWEKLIKMALLFQIQDLKDSVEYFLMDHYEVAIWSDAKKLTIGDKYGMESYKEATLEGIIDEGEVEEMKESEEYQELAKTLKDRIDERVGEIKKKKEKK
ncbi:hypothetical protein PMAYCL1PPCAC_24329 [Pristionchus mayeri]|uniref:BTB domain-containing protein n=1 Tax=Pristionchus mayeri TaxID=1317129 RepID=A0AAN5I798_9BILA|nr:hypothetical protein PMAYCL1PPCAC_24329 [Pristionchus mayeri]